uniref:Uncharacterized protein n=1 Tax=Octopus bimaculoides TaxID=37653 RepID=A0A0L8IHH2_OCTBM
MTTRKYLKVEYEPNKVRCPCNHLGETSFTFFFPSLLILDKGQPSETSSTYYYLSSPSNVLLILYTAYIKAYGLGYSAHNQKVLEQDTLFQIAPVHSAVKNE